MEMSAQPFDKGRRGNEDGGGDERRSRPSSLNRCRRLSGASPHNRGGSWSRGGGGESHARQRLATARRFVMLALSSPSRRVTGAEERRRTSGTSTTTSVERRILIRLSPSRRRARRRGTRWQLSLGLSGSERQTDGGSGSSSGLMTCMFPVPEGAQHCCSVVSKEQQRLISPLKTSVHVQGTGHPGSPRRSRTCKIFPDHISHCGSSKWFYTSKGGFSPIPRDN